MLIFIKIIENVRAGIMNKTILRVVFAPNPPDIYDDCQKFPTIVPSFECPYPGWTAEVLGMVAEYLQWKIEPIIVKKESGGLDTGAFNNDTHSWSGLLGYLYRNEADTICLSYEYLTFRDKYFDYSFPLYSMQVVYVSKHNTKTVLSALWNSFIPFPYSVWLVIISFIFIQATYGTIVRYMEWKMRYEDVFYPFEKYWQYLKIFLLQPEDTKTFKSAAGVLAFALFLVLTVLAFTNLYKVSVLSALLKAPDLLPYHTSSEMFQLLATGQYKLITTRLNYEANWYFDDLRESGDPHFASLREALKNNPILIVENISVALVYLQKGGYIYPSAQDDNLIPLTQGFCDMYYFSKDTPQKSVYFIFPNASRLVQPWNRGLIMNIDYVGHTFSKYFENGLIGPPYPRCSDLDALPGAYKSLDFLSTFGVFFITLCLLVVSGICLVSEYYINWHYKLVREKRRSHEKKIFMSSVFSHLEKFFVAHQNFKRRFTRAENVVPAEFLKEQNRIFIIDSIK